MQVQYPNCYAWLVLFSALDVMLTWVVLNLGGAEANPLARAVIAWAGLMGMSVYKFLLVAVFVVLCDTVGRMQERTGLMLARVGVGIAVMPVGWTLGLLASSLAG